MYDVSKLDKIREEIKKQHINQWNNKGTVKIVNERDRKNDHGSFDKWQYCNFPSHVDLSKFDKYEYFGYELH